LKMSSRQRMLAALDRQTIDHIPCSFMLFGGLLTVSTDYLAFVQSQLDMGLDAYVQIPPRQPHLTSDTYNLHGLPVRFDPHVEIEERLENRPDQRYPVLVKRYHTPAGTLKTEVLQTDDWPYGDHVPFLDDYLSSRSLKFLIDRDGDLEALAYLLQPPDQNEIADFEAASRPAIELARSKDLLLVSGWGVGADMLGWIFGLQNMLYAIFDFPDFIQKMLDLIAEWNHRRMQVMLSAGVDLFIKRAWYENCDFWTPSKFRQFLAPILKREVEQAHRSGARFGYLITSNCMPLLETIAECGVDVVIGADPRTWDLEQARRTLDNRMCVWGGVNGHLAVEQGSPAAVRTQTRRAMEIFAEGGHLILSPVDNVRELTDRSRENVLAMINEWQRLINQPPK
jgi:hypothetical protein